ncbi:MAG: hypothetical protein AAFU67_16720 [Bacteroidota bacterium]
MNKSILFKKIGVVTGKEMIKGISESEYGGKVVIRGIQIDYLFVIDRDTLTGSDAIMRRNAKQSAWYEMNSKSIGDTIRVLYDPERGKSILKTSE